MSAGKVLTQVNRLWQLLGAATPRPWDPPNALGAWVQGHKVESREQAIADGNLIVGAVNALPALLELKRAAVAWALALEEIHTKTFTGPGPHYELEAFQKREHDLAELALVVLEAIE